MDIYYKDKAEMTKSFIKMEAEQIINSILERLFKKETILQNVIACWGRCNRGVCLVYTTEQLSTVLY